MTGTMDGAVGIPRLGKVTAWAAEEAACLLFGAGLTFGLFFGIAHFENVRAQPAAQAIEDLRAVTAVVEPPPPKVEEHPLQPVSTVPLTGIEIGAAESPVKIAVVPPDLAKIMPQTDLPPRATIQFNQLLTDLSPKMGIEGDFQHIYQQNEVDKVPEAVVKTIAKVNSYIRDNADELRVTLLLVIDTEGGIESIKVMKASSNKLFDKAVMECVREEWVFSPAIRRGKKVRCMVQQLVWYKWTDGNKFTL